MHLKSLTLKGFKSFPDRTRLDFGPGVSVVVGPNGSGKSNITDAVLWAMGEQSPLAVRGQSMQDVIFGGGHGVAARKEAEVELVLDNSDGTVELPLSEISIVRRLDRTGDGGYRLNGARCRLSDVIEVLSDTGLGKETHSIISQGRVDSIVSSRPRDRRLLIEEAAGLGKHRKRRRRAQLKLERTQENLDRALDVEREARGRLRPLKRQAEAAELHERLERQTLEARLELARDASARARAELARAEGRAADTRAERGALEARLEQTVARRGRAERALAERSERHDELARRAFAARSAHERLELRAEQAAAASRVLDARAARVRAALADVGQASADRAGGVDDGGGGADRLAALEAELSQLDAKRAQEVEEEIAELRQAGERQRAAVGEREDAVERAREQRRLAEQRAADARAGLAAAERAAADARREAERVGAELAAVNQFLHSHAGVPAGPQEGSGRARTLSDELDVQEGYELALAAALGGRLDAALVADVAGAQQLLDRAGPDGGTALLADGADAAPAGSLPGAGLAGARRLLDLVSGPPPVLALAQRLLADAWVVERLEDVPRDFAGIAATREGRVWFGGWGEVRQLTAGGSERVLARRNERERLIAATERASGAEQAARATQEAALAETLAGEEALATADAALHEAERALVQAREERRRTEWLIEQRRAAPAQGPLAVRRAELEGALAAERREAERVERERAQRAAREQRLREQLAADSAAQPAAGRLLAALAKAREAVQARVAALEQELAEDRRAGERVAGELSACAAEEAEVQTALRAAGELVTEAEVAAQRLRDQLAEAELELRGVCGRLGFAAYEPATASGEDAAGEEVAGEEGGAGEAQPEFAAASEPLDDEQRRALDERVQRLTRRREQLGPVNPLAQQEYAEAVEHVGDLESQRGDLETALRELRGVIREADEQIQRIFESTFTAAADNFSELIGDVFPGGSGRLRLVVDEQAQRPVLGGEPLAPGSEGDAEAAAEAELEREEDDEDSSQLGQLGVEIEVTPAGKSTKRLSLLSGGEKSMTALAFLFAVFLARPCPFYILDEVEAALDDANLDRFLALLRRYSQRAQFIVVTHQKRTMEAADWLYGVSMGRDGVSKILSQKLPPAEDRLPDVAEVA
jgi:chromosome segregation protein